MRFLLLLFSLLLWCNNLEAKPREQVHVAVGQIVEHKALDTLRLSLKKGLEEKGFIIGKNMKWTYENAQGNPTTAAQIAHKLVGMEPTVIVTLSTPMTQATVTATSQIPIVFAAVTDPKSAKLVGHPNVTGLTDYVPPLKQIEIVRSFIPKLKSLGVIFNAGEANSRSQVEAMKSLCETEGISLVEASVSKSSEVAASTKSLMGRVEAILLPTDNTVITALESILKIATHHKIPVFGSDVDVVRRGALAAYGVDWEASGYTVASIVAHILKGMAIKDLPIENPKTYRLHINERVARELEIHIPVDLRDDAELVL